MTYFDDPQHAAEAADEGRTELIALYLARHDREPRTEFFTVVDNAIYAEDWAKLHGGEYRPSGMATRWRSVCDGLPRRPGGRGWCCGLSGYDPVTMADMLRVANSPGFDRWQEQVRRTGGCSNPIHLTGQTVTA